MTFPDLFDEFRTAVLPGGASDPTLSNLESVARYTSAREGDAPFNGIGVDQIVFIAGGSTKLVAHVSQGREQVVAFHFRGDLVSVPASAAHAYTLCALEDCELVFFPADDFLQIAQQEPHLVITILERTLRSLARSREKSVALGRKTAEERLASFLVTMAERIGWSRDGAVELDLIMSRRDIGDSLGLTIETVSRQLSELRNACLIETSGRSRFRLLDLPSLHRRAGHLELAG
ncbi:helix-turn-helix domain-containing protein [Erythrobacter sp. F6033]|uniref:Crp/Fnr family transcriptional regulator n=1 Tax=Erythrobacter sp. F6033 TaxID=2926401 RepID=UPI001FF5DF3F|nr:helix-turn-helix domain-containing protein [Erythrobacter sp. F6033]MCK0127560.1 helix-turn-helix domain-containing protein [Erythrobacter sp. F6033]